MKGIILSLVCFVNTFLLASGIAAYAQCPSPQGWLDEIKTIENSEAPNVEKISGLLSLKLAYQKCGGHHDSIYAVLLHRIGSFYMRQNAYEEAIQYTKEAVSINNSHTPLAQRSFLAHSYFNLALIYDRIILQADSRKYYDSCIQVASHYPEKTFISLSAFQNQAFSFFQSGDYQKSIDNADKGILMAVREKDVVWEAMLLLQKAQAQLALNEIVTAEQNVQQMIGLLEHGEGVSEYLASAYSVYAKLLIKKGKLADAVAYFKKAATANRKHGQSEQYARDLHDLGLLYDKDLRDPANALFCYREAIELAKQLGAVDQVAALYNNMGEVYWGQKKHRTALAYYQKGLAEMTYRPADTAFTAVIPLQALQMTTNDHFVATLLANKGESLLTLYQEEHDPTLLQLALKTFRLTDKMVDQLRWKQVDERSKLYWRDHTRMWYENAIETCYQLKDAESGFYFFEKSRSVLLSDKLNELGAQRGLSSADLEQDQQLRVAKFSFEKQLLDLDEQDSAYTKVKQKYFASKEKLEHFIIGLEKKYPSYYHYKYDTASPSLDAFRREILHNDVSLVSYFTTPSLVYALSVTPDEIQFEKFAYDDYHKDAVRFLALCADKEALNADHDSYVQLANQIYKKLFDPLKITTARLIISQDDHFIPFEALIPDPAAPSEYLLKRYAITYAYSVGYLMQNRNKMTGKDSWLGVTPIKFASSLNVPSLLGADQSLKNIGANFSSPNFLLAQKATKREFLRELPSYTIVHLYSHARADSTGADPALYFYDSLLTLSELQTLDKLQARLIVLTACETGAGRQMKGEGVFSLARGFAAAGIPSTVTTLWEIDEKATYKLTELFYKYLQDGNPGDVAIQKAKLEFIASNDVEYALPYYWAPTILIGQTGVLQKGTGMLTKVVYGFAGAILIVVIGLFIRKRYSSGLNPQ